MNQRCKAALLILAAVVGLLLFLSYLSRQLFLESFRRIEAEQVQRNLSRTREALAERTARLGRGDWAAWDELYDFVLNGDPEFAKVNLIDVTYDDLQVNAIVIADEAGKVIYSGGYDLIAGRATEFPTGLVPHVAPGSLLLSHPDEKSEISGLLLLPEGPLLVSSLPILTSERHGPIRGSLVMARFLDDSETAHISQMTHLNLSFQRLDNPLPRNFPLTAGSVDADASGVFVVDADTIGGYSVISDLTGEPAVMARILQPRPIYRQGARTVRIFLVWFSVATCALVGVCSVLFDRLVLSRAMGRESEARFRNIFEHAAAGMTTISLDGHYMQANPAFLAFVGYSAEELDAADVFQITHPEDLDATRAMLNSVKGGGLRTYDYEKRFLRKDGEVVWGRVTAAWLQDSEGKPTYAVALIQDITKRKRAEDGLHLARFCIDHAAIGIFRIEADGRITEVNDQACSSLGYSRDELGSLTVFDIDPELSRDWWFEHREGLMRTKESKTIETRHRRKDGSIFPVEVTINYLEYAGRSFVYSFVKDITERKRHEEQLKHLATHDELTGLANRALLLDRLEQSIHYANRSGRLVAVLLLDLDRFKVINDSLGHYIGDKLLCSVAQRLKQSVREADTVARLGGDEFVILLAEVAEVEDVGLVAAKILRLLAEPHRLDEREITLTASLGISLFPRDSDDGATLIRNADLAMYRAKRDETSSFAFYSPEMNHRIIEVLELENALRHGLEFDEFVLHYQPKVDLASGRVTGCEALVRWCHPQRGMVSPADFISLAEETGLIVPLGTWVLKEACRQVKSWQVKGLPTPSVAVNLSARQFRTGNLPRLVEEILREANLDPALLELELTESMVMNDPAGAERIMRAIKSLGVGLSLDDFGTGYSSLNYLARFPVDSLKIDRSFISDVANDPSGASVVTSIIDIAHNLGLTAVAEGVETREQYAFLSGCGCDMIQGYLFSKPLPAEEFANLLREGRRLRSL